MEKKSKIILHEENCNERDLEYFIPELLLSARPGSGLSQFDLRSVAAKFRREGLDPSWIHSQPRGLPAWAPAWGRSPWCSALHTQSTLFILKASASQPDESREKEIKRLTPATQQVSGRAGKSSPTVTPVSPGETRPGSSVPRLGKGRVSSTLLISTEKWG